MEKMFLGIKKEKMSFSWQSFGIMQLILDDKRNNLLFE